MLASLAFSYIPPTHLKKQNTKALPHVKWYIQPKLHSNAKSTSGVSMWWKFYMIDACDLGCGSLCKCELQYRGSNLVVLRYSKHHGIHAYITGSLTLLEEPTSAFYLYTTNNYYLICTCIHTAPASANSLNHCATAVSNAENKVPTLQKPFAKKSQPINIIWRCPMIEYPWSISWWWSC